MTYKEVKKEFPFIEDYELKNIYNGIGDVFWKEKDIKEFLADFSSCFSGDGSLSIYYKDNKSPPDEMIGKDNFTNFSTVRTWNLCLMDLTRVIYFV